MADFQPENEPSDLRDRLARFLGVAPDGTPQAELWLGAHPSDPSEVWCDGRWVPLPKSRKFRQPPGCILVLKGRSGAGPHHMSQSIPSGTWQLGFGCSAPPLLTVEFNPVFPRNPTAKPKFHMTVASTGTDIKSRTCSESSRIGGASTPAMTDAHIPSCPRSASPRL